MAKQAKRKSWSQIAHYYFDKYGGFEFLLKCNYDPNMLEQIPNFYRLMLEFLDELIIKPESNNILWNNKEITINGRTIFLKEWFNNGIITISDMLKENNLFYTIKELEENFNIKTNFVTYYGITQAIRKTKIALNKILYNNEPITIVETFNLNQINITSAKSRAFYNEFILLKTHEPSALNTWVNEINTGEQEFYESFPHTKDSFSETKLLDFQYKVLNGYLAVGTTLCKWQVRENSLCKVCSGTDSIVHCLFSCQQTQRSLKEVYDYLSFCECGEFDFTEKDIILGVPDIAINMLLLITKQYIWKVRYFDLKFNLYSLRIEFFKRVLIDKKRLSNQKFEAKWSNYHKLIENLYADFASLNT